MKNYSKIFVLFAVVFCLVLSVSFTVNAAGNSVCISQTITTTSDLNDGDKVSFKNLFWRGQTYLNWYLDSASLPKLQVSPYKAAIGTFNDRFTVKKFATGVYGYYVTVSSKNYYITVTSTGVELALENSVDINKAKFNTTASSSICTLKPTLTPTLYLYQDNTISKPIITMGAEGTGGGLNWELTKGVPCTVTYTKMSDWGTGYEAKITITNNGTKTISNWGLFMKFNAKINSIYDADVKNYVDNPTGTDDTYVIKNKGWNASIAPNATVSFGFGGTPGGIASAASFDVLDVVLLPLSSAEVPYAPTKWNDGGAIQKTTNCYAYALNLQKNPITGQSFPIPGGSGYCLQPGELGSYKTNWERALNDISGVEFVTACQKDAAAIGGTFTSVNRTSACSAGTYKVALVLDLGTDYHWYRQNPDGTWSHKPGITPVKDLDNAKQKIDDPQMANRGGYTIFLGYFAVKSIPAGAPAVALPAPAPAVSTNYVSLMTDTTNKARTKADFTFLKAGMTGSEVRSKVGLPQSNYGSGIIMDAYNLTDGSIFVISYGATRQTVAKAFFVNPDGTRQVIF